MIVDFLAAAIISAGATIGIAIGVAGVAIAISLAFRWSIRS